MPNAYTLMKQQGIFNLADDPSSREPSEEEKLMALLAQQGKQSQPDTTNDAMSLVTDNSSQAPQTPSGETAQGSDFVNWLSGQKVQPAPSGNRKLASAQPAKQSGGSADPFSLSSLYQQLRSEHEKSQLAERASLQEQKDALEQYAQSQNNPLTALLAYVDTTTGSNYRGAYNDHLNQKKAVVDAKNAITKAESGISKSDEELLKSLITAKSKETSAEYLNAYRTGQLDAANRRLGIRMDEAAGRVADKIDKDPIVLNLNKRLGQIEIDRHTLETQPVINKAVAGELARGVANALSGAGAAGWHEVEMQIPKSMRGDLVAIMNYTDGDVGEYLSPKQREYLINTLRRLEEGFTQTMARRAKEIEYGREYSNPILKKTMSSKVNALQTPQGQSAQSSEDGQGITSDERSELERLRAKHGKR
jgi:hypothetical protein